MKVDFGCSRLTDVDLSCTSVAPYSDSGFGGRMKVCIVITSAILLAALLAAGIGGLIMWSSAMRVGL